ncbi:hypothetical protein [Nonomuraea sp. NPDC005692]|uniref:hypothetical protein n=1 Tax=Nonomuraea sp. NPDC005692 TaxID=3157168 RepID=UPI0033FD8462
MKVAADGRTPLPRSLIANEVETDDGYVFELESPLLLNVDDRLGFENGRLVVERVAGGRLALRGRGPRDAVDTEARSPFMWRRLIRSRWRRGRGDRL